jgi:hypothetical protein
MNEQPNTTARMILCGIIGFALGVSFQTPSDVRIDYRNRMDFEEHGDMQYQAGFEDGKAVVRMEGGRDD